MKEKIYIESPIGILAVCCEDGCVTAITVVAEEERGDSVVTPFTLLVKRELEAYFNSETKELAFPVCMKGTAFRIMVWKELLRIPYGTTVTYGEVAERIGKPQASRAVGMACNRNPLLIAVPCHRVVGAGGTMTGFAVGIERKEFLLKLEQENKSKDI